MVRKTPKKQHPISTLCRCWITQISNLSQPSCESPAERTSNLSLSTTESTTDLFSCRRRNIVTNDRSWRPQRTRSEGRKEAGHKLLLKKSAWMLQYHLSPYADNIDWRHFSPFGKSLVQRSSTLCSRHFTCNCLVNAGGSWKIVVFFPVFSMWRKG